MTTREKIARLWRQIRGPRWRPTSDLSPMDTISMIHHAGYDMYFALIHGPDHYEQSALIWRRYNGPQLFIVIDPPSSKIIEAAYRARVAQATK